MNAGPTSDLRAGLAPLPLPLVHELLLLRELEEPVRFRLDVRLSLLDGRVQLGELGEAQPLCLSRGQLSPAPLGLGKLKGWWWVGMVVVFDRGVGS